LSGDLNDKTSTRRAKLTFVEFKSKYSLHSFRDYTTDIRLFGFGVNLQLKEGSKVIKDIALCFMPS